MNLYAHFPFCRRKCAYCALHSRAGASAADRAAYVARLAEDLPGHLTASAREAGASDRLATIYFGGGSPGLCDLHPLFAALAPYRTEATEFTVELHPLDVTAPLLATLCEGGVNRVSMGVQSLDDATLCAMGRGYTADEAKRAFLLIKEYFDNAGIDLIVGYPGPAACTPHIPRLADWGLRHCSVYSLILEEGTLLARRVGSGRIALPDDDAVMDALQSVARDLAALGLERYEISNYAVPGYECRHNFATWRGEDYIGLGEGAHGRLGLLRTVSGVAETISPDADLKERTLFRLRTREGLDASRFPEWQKPLDRFVAEGVLRGMFPRYYLTGRGLEICDTILAELV